MKGYPWFSHLALYRIITFNISILNESLLRIGAGRGGPLSTADLPVLTVRLPQGNTPYIPGSSLKGTFRSTVEYIASSLKVGICHAGACSTFQDEKEGIRYGDKLQRLLRDGKEKEALNLLSKKYCLICKIFGSSSFSSHINFGDAYPEGEVSRDIKAGIAINRRSGAVQRGALYQVEFINPGHRFKNSIVTKNLPNYSLGLLATAFDYFNEGIMKLGGFKSRGFGKVQIKVEGIEGKTLENGSYRSLRDVKRLPALDEYDVNVEIDVNDVDKTLQAFKKAWWEYAGKQGTSS